jgi:hypothetical protein
VESATTTTEGTRTAATNPFRMADTPAHVVPDDEEKRAAARRAARMRRRHEGEKAKVCVYACVCVYMCMHVCVCICVCTCVCVYVYARVCVCMCMHVCVWVRWGELSFSVSLMRSRASLCGRSVRRA